MGRKTIPHQEKITIVRSAVKNKVVEKLGGEEKAQEFATKSLNTEYERLSGISNN